MNAPKGPKAYPMNILEYVVADYLYALLEETDVHGLHQSGFKLALWTKTVLLILMDNLHLGIDIGNVTLLILLAVSVTFDTVRSKSSEPSRRFLSVAL